MSLEIGLRRPLTVRRERLELGLGLSLLYVSDLHMRPGNQEHLQREIWEAYQTHRPNVVLLGGDLCDHLACLDAVESLVGRFARSSLVGAVPGNHDTLLGKARVREAVVQAGAHWLPDGPVESQGVQLLGSPEHKRGSLPAVLCSHYPTVFPEAIRARIELVLAGHLHGWQVVFAQWGEYLYPGAWLSRWNGLRFSRENSTMLVSRGVTDLLPVRWNCPREVILAIL